MWNIKIAHLILIFNIIEVNVAEATKALKIPEVGEAPMLKDINNITIEGGSFILNGMPTRILSGSAHYFRIPSAYWRDRLRKLKAAGLNAVSTYIDWSYHEPEEREYMFVGEHDVVKFIQIASEERLYVLVAPGPYICADRDLGGLPYWLLSRYPNIRLRSKDPDFLYETETWMSVLFSLLDPLFYGNGGPIILVQVENEYSSYGKSRVYMNKLQDIFLKHVGKKALLCTTDRKGVGMFPSGSEVRMIATVGFPPGGPELQNTIKFLKSRQKSAPLMASAFFIGWPTHWTECLSHINESTIVDSLHKLLQAQVNVNFYPFHGGTNFEFSSGANILGESFWPITTSYDSDAPLTEAGDPTPKYFAIRDEIHKRKVEPSAPDLKGRDVRLTIALAPSKPLVIVLSCIQNKGQVSVSSHVPFHSEDHSSDIVKYLENHTTTAALSKDNYCEMHYPQMMQMTSPKESRKGSYGPFSVTFQFHLLSKQGRSILGKRYHDSNGHKLPTFEKLRQRAGLVLYETLIRGDGTLSITQPRDIVYVYVDGLYMAVIDRMTRTYNTKLIARKYSTLSLLVENQGRIHFGVEKSISAHPFLSMFDESVKSGSELYDFKGILSNVTYNNKVLENWKVTGFPLSNIGEWVKGNSINYGEQGASLYYTNFTLSGQTSRLDTFIDTRGWSKGSIWVNGHNLGRYWSTRGPQLTLYLPGAWLLPSPKCNHIHILELHSAHPNLTINFVQRPLYLKFGKVPKEDIPIQNKKEWLTGLVKFFDALGETVALPWIWFKSKFLQ